MIESENAARPPGDSPRASPKMKMHDTTPINNTDDSFDKKCQQMRSILRELKSVAVAFSAGIDSTLVLKVALDELGPENVVAVTGKSDSLAATEFQSACQIAEEVGAEHVILDTDEFADPNYVSNPINRCYHCKTTLYTRLAEFIQERGINAIVNGINADDYGDYRPGIEAAKEQSVCAPVAEAGMTKKDVRTLALQLGLPTFDKPASPCLSSRVQYGEEITPEKLKMVDAGEQFIKSLGITECRVRHHSDIARIEVPTEFFAMLSASEVATRIDAHFRSLGYKYVTLDLRGFRSGSMNEVIAFGQRQSIQ